LPRFRQVVPKEMPPASSSRSSSPSRAPRPATIDRRRRCSISGKQAEQRQHHEQDSQDQDPDVPPWHLPQPLPEPSGHWPDISPEALLCHTMDRPKTAMRRSRLDPATSADPAGHDCVILVPPLRSPARKGKASPAAIRWVSSRGGGRAAPKPAISARERDEAPRHDARARRRSEAPYRQQSTANGSFLIRPGSRFPIGTPYYRDAQDSPPRRGDLSDCLAYRWVFRRRSRHPGHPSDHGQQIRHRGRG
jgi:hypothetical protein